METKQQKMNRRLKGIVVSNKMTKTVVVRVDSLKKHHKYKKYFKVSKRYKAHAEVPYEVGDIVVIQETRPLSKEKRWKVVERLGSNKKLEHTEEMEDAVDVSADSGKDGADS